MSTSYQYKIIVDFYKNSNGTLKYIDNRIIFDETLEIIVDTVTPQLSKLSCLDVPELENGDFGIIKREGNNIHFFVSNVNREKESQEMNLQINAGIDVLNYKYICDGAKQLDFKSPSFWQIPNLVEAFNYDLSELERLARIKMPYYYIGSVCAVAVAFGSSGSKTHAQIIREKSRTNGVMCTFELVKQTNSEYATSDDYKLVCTLSQEEKRIINLNLDDLSVINTYKIDTSNMLYNVLVFEVVGSSGVVLRVDVDGNIQEPFDANLNENTLYDEKAILPAIVERTIIDPTNGNTNALESARNALLEQYYSSDIECEINVINKKIDLQNLDKLFSFNFKLWRNGVSINTVCTRYEWRGGDIVVVRFGSARTKLTEKIQKISQMQEGF